MSDTGEREITNIGYLVRTVRVVLSVLVGCEIRIACTLWAAKSERMSSSGTLDGILLSTRRGCTVSGDGYV